MVRSSEPRACSMCGVILTEANQSEALRRHNRKLCSPCGTNRTSAYEQKYVERKLAQKRESRRVAALLRKKPSDLDRLQKFFKPGDVDVCWPWTGAVNKQTGYGAFRLGGAAISAPRAVLILVSGIDMTELVARHKCDNRICVNPNHLEPGSQFENVQDSVQRGRTCSGTARVEAALNAKRVARRKLTEAQAIEAFNLVREGKSRASVAEQFGVCRSSIDCLMTGRTWSHVTGLACKRHTWKTQAETLEVPLNATRADHKLENRRDVGGKKF